MKSKRKKPLKIIKSMNEKKEKKGGVLNVISFGAGKQSSYMLLRSLEGFFDFKPDFAVFADTGCEPKETYTYLHWIKDYVKNKYNFDIVIVKYSNLVEDTIDYIDGKIKRGSAIPFFVESTGAPINRQCTLDYKINPVKRHLQKVREKMQVNLWMGISLDEIERMKKSRVKYITHYFPLIEKRITIDSIKQWFKENDLYEPMKSSCLICPFHSHNYWVNFKKNFPDEFQTAVEFDRKIRQLPKMKSKTFLYRGCIPLDKVDFTQVPTLFPELIEECYGLCGL